MQIATGNAPKTDQSSQLALTARNVLIDLALWCVALGSLARPEGHPETWLAAPELAPQIIAAARESAPRAPEIRGLLRARETAIGGLLSSMRATFRSALKKTRRERAHAEGIGEEDSLQDGALGLIRAVELWDPYRGLKFSTFATHWIEMQTRRGAQRNAHLKCAAAYSGDKERRAEGRKALSAPRYSVDYMLDMQSESMWGQANSTLSSIAHNVFRCMSVAPDAERRIDEASFRRELAAALERLPPKTRDIAISVMYRDETHQEIAHRLGVSRQAIGQTWLRIEAELRSRLGTLVARRTPAKSLA